MYRIIRTIVTSKGRLVLHEAGLQCPLPGTGPQVEMAAWGVAACVAETPWTGIAARDGGRRRGSLAARLPDHMDSPGLRGRRPSDS
jgi:hypothetical protein